MSSLSLVMASIVLGLTSITPQPTVEERFETCVEDPRSCRGAFIRSENYEIVRIVYTGQEPRACEMTVETLLNEGMSSSVIDIVTRERREWLIFLIQWMEMLDDECKVSTSSQ